MAEEGNRFKNEGYSIPKQLVNIFDKTMIEWSMNCIDYEDYKIIFIVREEHIKNYNIDIFLKNKFGDDCEIISTNKTTEGTVSTCLMAEEYIDNDLPLLITTLDVFFEPKLIFQSLFTSDDGTILIFDSENESYSYSLIGDDGYVIKTEEKKLISNNASVGIYHFSNSSIFLKYAKLLIKNNIRINNEFYICPIYNLLIKDGLKIKTKKVKTVNPLGTPEEINNFIKTHDRTFFINGYL